MERPPTAKPVGSAVARVVPSWLRPASGSAQCSFAAGGGDQQQLEIGEGRFAVGETGRRQFVPEVANEPADLRIGRAIEGDGGKAVGVVEEDAAASGFGVEGFNAQEVGVEMDEAAGGRFGGFETDVLMGDEEEERARGVGVLAGVGPEGSVSAFDVGDGEAVGARGFENLRHEVERADPNRRMPRTWIEEARSRRRHWKSVVDGHVAGIRNVNTAFFPALFLAFTLGAPSEVADDFGECSGLTLHEFQRHRILNRETRVS